MDPAEYRDARWHALLRSAADLGVPEDEAPALVERVLHEQRRAIRRTEDPDPLVHDALHDAVHPRPPVSRRIRVGAAAAGVLALVAVGVAVVLVRPDDPPVDRLDDDQLPSLFAYAADDARALLEERGLEVTIRPYRACEVLDRVLTTEPAAGTRIDRGDPVTVVTAVPAGLGCLLDYIDREDAWRLLDFAGGRGPAPAFADRVLVRAGDAPPVTLDRATASSREGWAATGVLDGLRDASSEVVLVTPEPLRYAVPAIRVVQARDRVDSCGLPDPAVARAGDAFTLLIRPPDRAACGVRVDVFREDGAIEAIAYYPASS